MTMFEMPEPVERPPTSAQVRKDKEQFVEMFMYALTAPYIVFTGYEDSWSMLNRSGEALTYRLLGLTTIFETEQCSEFEAMTYLSTATLAHVPGREVSDAYFWLFKRWSPEKAKLVPIGPEHDELDWSAKEFITRLRGWIFRTQLKHMKARGEAVAIEDQAVAEDAAPAVVQMQMFGEESGSDVA